jgi:hypothetical protein
MGRKLSSGTGGPSSERGLAVLGDGTRVWRKRSRCGMRDMVVERIDPAVFKVRVPPKGCFYLEFRDVDASEYSRSVLVEG